MEAKQKKRSEIPAAYKWRPHDLVPSDEAWRQQLDALPIAQLAGFKGKLASGENLLACLSAQAALDEAFSRLYVYAHMKMHEDTADTTYQAMADTASQMHVKIMAAQSFIEPELLAIDEKALRGWLDAVPGLDLYRHYLEDLLRQKAHVLSAEVEEVLANARELGAAPDHIFEMLDNADLKFGTVTDEDGQQIELTHGRYGALLQSSKRTVRQDAWHTFYDSYWYLKNTLAAAYSASVKKDVFFAKTRKYPSALEATLFSGNIPKQVYTGLIETVRSFLPQMHRYMRLRQKALALPDLRVYDLYTPMVKQVNDRVPYEEAKEKVLASLAPLGAAYVDVARKGLSPEGGWVDVYENEGKSNGAYSWGAFGGHPYILLNYENKIDDLFTLAHELGHAMHSHYSWENQPFVYSDYTIFLAEVASTVNEALLMEHLLQNADDAMGAYLINIFLDQFRTTVFRQTLFAEFEMRSHEMAEAGEPLTVEALNQLYRELNAAYYGDTLTPEDKLDLEWARIPHFYRAFYVYQYATGYSAAMAFANRILGKGDVAPQEAVSQYLDFLKSGSSDYSIRILQKAGVDMSSPQPVREALTLFEALLDKMEQKLGFA